MHRLVLLASLISVVPACTSSADEPSTDTGQLVRVNDQMFAGCQEGDGTTCTIDVTFVDGELLSGRTLNYAGDGPGFFMTPVDNTTNNHRIFVVNNAVRSVQFP